MNLKKIIAAIVFLLLWSCGGPVAPARAETLYTLPKEIHYEIINDDPVDGTFEIMVEIEEILASGDTITVYTEVHPSVEVVSGMFFLDIGSIKPLPYFSTSKLKVRAWTTTGASLSTSQTVDAVPVGGASGGLVGGAPGTGGGAAPGAGCECELVKAGPVTIESTEKGVVIMAGASRITVDPSGGVTIESTASVNIKSAGDLNLKAARKVTLEAGAGMRIRAASDIDMKAARINLN